MKPLLLILLTTAAHAATPIADIKVPPGFKVELLREAGQREGSWISMTLDPEGRIYISPQGSIPESGLAKDSKWGGLWRATLAPQITNHKSPITKWQKVPIPIGDAMGMLWAFDSLYVSGNGPDGRGIYRCKDTDGDTLPDTAVLWKKIPGGAGEHGAHALILSPDKASIYIVHGNATGLIDDIAPDSPYRNWGEDDLLPKLKDPTATFFDKISAPYGYILRTDEHGKKWELIAGGMRNAYDLDFNTHGELFTYDSDMEWDRGLPWYRPTRVLHIVPGGEYGFREGSAKMPAYYPDTLPAVVDIGLGCPTGVKFGTAAKDWPEEYRRAFFICDWTYGRILAVHMREKGASYTATNPLKSPTFPKDAESSPDVEPFIVGKGMSVTDIEFLPDGSMVFTTGGRGTSAGLYRVTWLGEKQAALDWANSGEEIWNVRSFIEETPRDIPFEKGVAEWEQKRSGFRPSEILGAKTPWRGLRPTARPALTSKVIIALSGWNPPGLAEEAERRSLALMEEGLMRVLAERDRKVVRHTATVGGGSSWVRTLELVESGDTFAAFATILDACHRDEEVNKGDFLRPAVREAWRLKGKTPADSRLALLYALASARSHMPELQEEIFNLLKELPLADLPDDLKLLKLRILQLTFARHGRPSDEWQKVGLEKLLAAYPEQGPRAAELNRELSQLLVWLSQPELGDFTQKPGVPSEKGAILREKGGVPSEKGAILREKPRGADEKPRGADEKPRGADEKPRVADEKPRVADEKPRVADEKPRVADEKPRVADEKPRVADEKPRVVDEKPRVVFDSPRVVFDPPPSKTEPKRADFPASTEKTLTSVAVPNPGAVEHKGRAGQMFHAELGQQVIEKALALMDAAPSQEEQVSYALVLRWAHGWTPPQRERYFRWFHEKAVRFPGGNSMQGFIKKIHTEAASRVPADERPALAQWLAPLAGPAAEAIKPRPFIKAWTLPELETALDALKDRKPDAARGKQLYAEAQCARCHLYKDAGGNVGPDLSAVAQRFQRRDILEAITDPNKIVSDQYALTMLTVIKFGGGEEQVTGIMQEETSGTIRILTDPTTGASREFYHNIVLKKEKAQVSLMPPALLNTLTAEEVADLLAFMRE